MIGYNAQESLLDTDRPRLITYGPFHTERDETPSRPDSISLSEP